MGGSPSLIMWPEPARYWAICAQLKLRRGRLAHLNVRFAAYLSRQQTAAPGGVVAVGNQRRLGQFRLEILMLCPAAPAAKPSRRLPSSAMASRRGC